MAIALVEASPAAEVTRIRSKLEDVVVVAPARLIPNVDKLCTPNRHRHGLIISSGCVSACRSVGVTKQPTRGIKKWELLYRVVNWENFTFTPVWSLKFVLEELVS